MNPLLIILLRFSSKPLIVSKPLLITPAESSLSASRLKSRAVTLGNISFQALHISIICYEAFRQWLIGTLKDQPINNNPVSRKETNLGQLSTHYLYTQVLNGAISLHRNTPYGFIRKVFKGSIQTCTLGVKLSSHAKVLFR